MQKIAYSFNVFLAFEYEYVNIAKGSWQAGRRLVIATFFFLDSTDSTLLQLENFILCQELTVLFCDYFRFLVFMIHVLTLN